MTYRNDHEAALLRVDALEQEVARLRSAPAPAAPKPATKRKTHASLLRVGLAVVLAGAGLVAVVSRDRPVVQAAPPPAMVAPAAVDPLTDCIAKIAPLDRAMNETTTDPHGDASSIAVIAKTGAPCRGELAAITVEDPALSAALQKWAKAEDRLADPISMIAVYYGSNPYTLDNYATAPQLWREYNRARDARDAILVELKPMLANGIAVR